MLRSRANHKSNARAYVLDALERRVLLSGDLDPTFGLGGLAQGPVSPSQPGYSHSVAAVQSDGKLLVFAEGTQLTAFRFLASGALDPSFGSNGSTVLTTASTSEFILQTAAGNIFAGSQNAVYELTSGGALVSSFGSNGYVSIPTTDSIVCGAADGDNGFDQHH